MPVKSLPVLLNSANLFYLPLDHLAVVSWNLRVPLKQVLVIVRSPANYNDVILRVSMKPRRFPTNYNIVI